MNPGIFVFKMLILRRAVSAAVIGIDHPYFIAHAGEKICDMGFAGSDLDQFRPRFDVSQNGLKQPGALHILEVMIDDRKVAQMIHAVAIIADRGIGKLRRPIELVSFVRLTQFIVSEQQIAPRMTGSIVQRLPDLRFRFKQSPDKSRNIPQLFRSN